MFPYRPLFCLVLALFLVSFIRRVCDPKVYQLPNFRNNNKLSKGYLLVPINFLHSPEFPNMFHHVSPVLLYIPPVLRYTPCTLIHSSVLPYTPLYSHISPCTTIYPPVLLYPPVLRYTPCTLIHPSVLPYIPLYSHNIPLYLHISPCTPL